jgi:hypothetical protein
MQLNKSGERIRQTRVRWNEHQHTYFGATWMGWKGIESIASGGMGCMHWLRGDQDRKWSENVGMGMWFFLKKNIFKRGCTDYCKYPGLRKCVVFLRTNQI